MASQPHPKFFDLVQRYEEMLHHSLPAKSAEDKMAPLFSVLCRLILPQLGFQRVDPTGKMTADEKVAAIDFMKQLTIRDILKAKSALEIGIAALGTPKPSYRNYRSHFGQFEAYAQQLDIYPHPEKSILMAERCGPIKQLQGSRTKLTSRTGAYKAYAKKIEELSPKAQKELKDARRFFTDPNDSFRVFKYLNIDSYDTYEKEILLIYGFLEKYANPKIPADDLCLDCLFPVINPADIADLNEYNRQQFWLPYQNKLKQIRSAYYAFIEGFSQSTSPSTRANKDTAIIAYIKFQYRMFVNDKKDYDDNRLIQAMRTGLNLQIQAKQRRQKHRQTETDEALKFPDPVEGKTDLEVMRETVLMPIRRECGCRYDIGSRRSRSALAGNFQDFLMVALLTEMPARRQEDQRELRIALSCPVQKPELEKIPPGGWYMPLPPKSAREHRNGQLIDKYLYRTYFYDRQYYPEGLFLLDLQAYKTADSYGPQTLKIPNVQYEDGTCTYYYLERWLCGWWETTDRTGDVLYTGHEPDLQGRRGRWLTRGRIGSARTVDHCAQSSSQDTVWDWSLLFVTPRTGDSYDDSSYASAFSRLVDRFINKGTTPHTLRSMWATWGIESGLNEEQLEELAYAMGHSVEIMKKLYVRRRPFKDTGALEAIIGELIHTRAAPWLDGNPQVTRLRQIMGLVRSLSAENQTALLTWTQELLVKGD
jgi:hypothetical protein